MNSKVFQRMQENLDRLNGISVKENRKDGNTVSYKPYFSSMSVKKQEKYTIEMLDGSVLNFQEPKKMSPYGGRLEIRMGNPKEGGGVSYTQFTLPPNLEKNPSKKGLEYTMTKGFWDSVIDLDQRITNSHGKPPGEGREGEFAYFSKEQPITYFDNDVKLSTKNLEKFAQDLKKLSKSIERPWVEDININLHADKESRYFINTEGSKIFSNNKIYSIELILTSKDKQNRLLSNFFKVYSRKMPSYGYLEKEFNKTLNGLEEIISSPIQNNGVFPAILDQRNTGVLAHEGIGHAAEGHRIRENEWEESNVLRGRMDERIAPKFINIIDDPTLRKFSGKLLNGHYLYDEEGMKSQKVDLIENGKLKNYLLSRESAGFFNTKSNGHARAEGISEPTPRMSNLIVNSSSPVSYKELKKQLIKECEKQETDYGLLFEGFGTSGWTKVEEGVYSLRPQHIFRIWKNGKTERVRGVDIMGTPHQALKSVMAMDNNLRLNDGVCGSESGIIPSTQIAPNSLIKNLEVNRIPSKEYVKLYESIFDKKK